MAAAIEQTQADVSSRLAMTDAKVAEQQMLLEQTRSAVTHDLDNRLQALSQVRGGVDKGSWGQAGA